MKLTVQLALIAIIVNCMSVISFGLRLTKFSVPSPVVEGDTVECKCEYDEGQDKLLALVWSINGTRFFRYEPNGGPSSKYALLKGDGSLFDDKLIKVSRKSNGTVLILDHVSTRLSGELTCSLIIDNDGPEFMLYEKRWLDVRKREKKSWAYGLKLFASSRGSRCSKCPRTSSISLLSVFLLSCSTVAYLYKHMTMKL
ncbi:hypothetical protein HDE_09193 [Halotydeus destructor]|nr:hypothetical protein HDE_09193 [Halotydeus destructor]